MPTPSRITLSRAKGWKMPPNTRKVDRTTNWGNPFYIDPRKAGKPEHPMACKDAQEAVAKYEGELLPDARLCGLIRTNLRGFNLACWCKAGDTCHADVLLRIANS